MSSNSPPSELFARTFSYARYCSQNVLNRHCKSSVPVPTSDRFNPFCHDLDFHQETTVGFQASKTSKNETHTTSKPQKPARNVASHTSRLLSRILGVTVGVVNLKATARRFGPNWRLDWTAKNWIIYHRIGILGSAHTDIFASNNNNNNNNINNNELKDTEKL